MSAPIRTVESLERLAVPAGDGFRNEVRNRINELIELSESSIGSLEEAHRRTLADLAGYIGTRPLNDLVLWALYSIESILGRVNAAGERVKGFSPGPEQITVLGNCGSNLSTTDPAEVAGDLVLAGINDVQAKLHRRASEFEEGKEAARRLDAMAQEVKEAEAELANARAEIREFGQERKNFKQKIEYLVGRVGAQAEPEEVKPTTERRAKVPNAPGIYKTGDTYEINYRDAEGKGHWDSVGTDLQEAERIRAERMGKVAVGA